jgi:hypothetical protein
MTMNLTLNGLVAAAPRGRFFGNQRNRALYVGECGLRQAVGARLQLLLLVLCIGWGVPGGAHAAGKAALAAVEAVQWPAWLERDGRQQPLAPGVSLQTGDRLATGSDGRVLVRLVDGSAVKLGAAAQLQVGALAQPESHLLSGVLDVLRGAFRYTTGVFGKTSYRRDFSIKVATLTIGIRGTDVWGKSADGRDTVLLLEGAVEVAHAEGGHSLTTPLSYLSSASGSAPELLSADAAQVAVWSAETEIDAKRPVGRAKGGFVATVASFNEEAAALAAYDRLRGLGYPVRLRLIEALAEAKEEPEKPLAEKPKAEKPPVEAAPRAQTAPLPEASPARQYLLRIENLGSRQEASRLAKTLRDALR